jgi:hypothetical protein
MVFAIKPCENALGVAKRLTLQIFRTVRGDSREVEQ